jgi:hypothetical protein
VFTEQLTEAEDWLYGDGEGEGAGAFTSKLADLTTVGNPMTSRAAEKEAREEVGSGCGVGAGWAGFWG